MLAALAGAIKIEEAFIEVEHHPPAGVIAVPVAGANHLLGITKIEPAEFFTGTKKARKLGAILEPAFGGAHPGMFQARFHGGGRELIAAEVGRSFGVMREPVFIGVDADEVLQSARQANLFVGFELGQVYEHIGVHGRAAEQILMAQAGMPFVGFGHVCRKHRRAGLARDSPRIHWRRPSALECCHRIAWEAGFETVTPSMACHSSGRKSNTRKSMPGKPARQRSSMASSPQYLLKAAKRGIGLRRVADDDGAVPGQPFCGPARHGFNDGRVRNDMFPLVRTWKAFVSVL